MPSTTRGFRPLTYLVAVLLISGPLFTLVPQTAEAQVTAINWSSDKIIATEFIVANTEQLVIDPGVTVYLDPDVNITVFGNITVRGQASQPVTFTWNQTGQAWGNINIFNARTESHFYNAFIRNAHEAIWASGSDLHVESSNISFNIMNGTHVTNAKATILGTSFFQNGMNPAFTDSAIYLNNATGTVDGNFIVNNNNGIFMKNDADVDVKNNFIWSSTSPKGFGIGMRSGTSSFVHDNTIYDNYVGVICNASTASVKDNTIEKNADDGIISTNQDSSTIHFNTIRLNGDDGVDISRGSKSFILSNEITNNTDVGVLVWDSDPQVFMNEIHNNSEGLRIDNGGNATTFANDIHDNSVAGIWLEDTDSYMWSMVDYIGFNTGVGVHVQNATVFLYDTMFEGHTDHIRVRDHSWVYLANGSMDSQSNCSFDFQASNVTILNLTRDDPKVCYGGETTNFTVMWYLGVKVVDGNGQPFPGVNVSIFPSWGGKASWEANTNDDGEVNWIPLVESYGLYEESIVLEVHPTPQTINVSYGGHSNTVTVSMTTSRNITIPLDVPNEPPVLNGTIPGLSFLEDTDAYSLLNLSEYFTDEGPLNYTMDYTEDSSTIDGQVNGTYVDFFTPTQDWFGTRSFRVKAIDGEGLTNLSNNFTVEVLPVNDPPTLATVTDKTVQVNEELSFQLHAEDVDNVLGEFTFSSDDVFISEVTVTIDPVQGFVTFSSMLQGSYLVQFYVCDPGPLCSGNITVNITVTGNNLQPFFTTNPLTTAHVNSSYLYTIGTRDPDGDPIELVLLFGPPGLELNDSLLIWVPTFDMVGDHDVSLRLTDGINEPGYQNFTIIVLPTNHAPEASILSPMDEEIFQEGEDISFSGRADDLDGDNLTYIWRIDGEVLSTDLGFSTTLAPGTHSVSFGVSDPLITTYYNITISVKALVRPPGPSVPHKTTVGGDGWCIWLPLTAIIMVVVVVILVNRFGLHRTEGQ